MAAEERGFAGLFVGDHTHIPARRTTPFFAGGELPEEYCRQLDPFVALATAAARTSTIRLGTCICLIAQRDPSVTAKQVASLDYVSGGRFVFGIGYGWNVEEASRPRDGMVDPAGPDPGVRGGHEGPVDRGRRPRSTAQFVDFDEAWAVAQAACGAPR